MARHEDLYVQIMKIVPFTFTNSTFSSIADAIGFSTWIKIVPKKLIAVGIFSADKCSKRNAVR